MSREEGRQLEFHQGFHEHTERKITLVEVEGVIYELSPYKHKTLRALLDSWPEDQPSPIVRHLNPIARRTKEQMKKEDLDSRFLTKLAKAARGDTKVTSVEKAIKLGANVPEEIEKLLKAKETASPEEARKIRQQLRKLDYKRYLKKGEE